jgi:hypothetical protein
MMKLSKADEAMIVKIIEHNGDAIRDAIKKSVHSDGDLIGKAHVSVGVAVGIGITLKYLREHP